jgi:glycosyltransferase involved in cell wall biosynthesis
MRIVIAAGIYPPEVGGPTTFVPVVAQGLQDAGHEVVVVTYGDEKTICSSWPVIVVFRGTSVLGRYLRYAFQIYKQARQADLIFLQGAISEGVPGTIAAMLANTPTVLRIPGDYAWEQYQQHIKENPEQLDDFVRHTHAGAIGLMERLERWVAKRAVRLVVPSFYLQRIISQWGVPTEKIEVVYNDVPSLPAPPQSRKEIRARFGIPPEAKILFSIARAVPWKGIEFLLSILPELPATHVFVIAGDGPLLETWRAHVLAEGLSKRVFFVGRWPHAELASWFQAADAFVLASAYEGFPHVAVEAAMQGLHGFLSDAGGNPETQTVFPGYTTILPYHDREAWIQALSQTEFPTHQPFVPHEQMTARVETLLAQVIA